MGKEKRSWRPPKGHIAVQTYISKDRYLALQSMRLYFDRSLRAELRHIINEAADKWVAAHKAQAEKR